MGLERLGQGGRSGYRVVLVVSLPTAPVLSLLEVHQELRVSVATGVAETLLACRRVTV